MTTQTPDEFGGATGRFRELRRRFEQAIPAAAVSMDGRSFSYQLSIGSTVPPPGGFVALVDGETRRLGQLITQELVTRDGPEVDRHPFLCGQSGSGKVVPTPTFVRFGARVSEEGGSDVSTDWARSRT